MQHVIILTPTKHTWLTSDCIHSRFTQKCGFIMISFITQKDPKKKKSYACSQVDVGVSDGLEEREGTSENKM